MHFIFNRKQSHLDADDIVNLQGKASVWYQACACHQKNALRKMHFAREKLDMRWMDSALLSSLHGRALEMFSTLLREPGGSMPFLTPLVQSIAARRDESELRKTLELATTAKPDVQAMALNALVKGRKNAPRKARGADAPVSATPVFTDFPSHSVCSVDSTHFRYSTAYSPNGVTVRRTENSRDFDSTPLGGVLECPPGPT